MTLEDLQALPPTISLTEVANVFGVSRSTAWEWYRRGDFDGGTIALGNRVRMKTAWLMRLLDVEPQADEVHP